MNNVHLQRFNESSKNEIKEEKKQQKLGPALCNANTPDRPTDRSTSQDNLLFLSIVNACC